VNIGRIIAKTVNAPVIFAFNAGSGVTGVAVTAGDRIAAKNIIPNTFYISRKMESPLSTGHNTKIS